MNGEAVGPVDCINGNEEALTTKHMKTGETSGPSDESL